MLAHPDLVAGTRDRIDTSIMKALPGRIISKGGMEALRGVAILPGPRARGQPAAASGMAIKIEDGDGFDRGTWAASIEALSQTGVLDGHPLRVLGRYHRPITTDPHGRARGRGGGNLRARAGGGAGALILARGPPGPGPALPARAAGPARRCRPGPALPARAASVRGRPISSVSYAPRNNRLPMYEFDDPCST